MDLQGLKCILRKLMVLNNDRMAEIRDTFVTTEADTAEYEDRFKERNWYDQAVMEIDIQLSGRSLQVLKLTRDELQLKIQKRLESRYDEVLERTRQTGAGNLSDDDWDREQEKFRLSLRAQCKEGGGRLRERGTYFFSTPDPDMEGETYDSVEAREKEVQGDYDFLESCGIKREIW